MSARSDVVVVGAGLAGASAAWELARRGKQVAVLDRFGPAHDRGSSHGTERIVRLGYTAPAYVRFGLAAIDGWRELEAECGEPLLRVTGVLDLGFDDELAEVAAALTGCGVDHEWLSAPAAAERWPGLRFEGNVLHQPDGGPIEADRALAALLAGAAARGADVRHDVRVEEIVSTPVGVAVRTADEEHVAPVAVVAAGAWAVPLLRGLVDLPPIKVTEEQVAYVETVEGSGPWPCFIHRGHPPLYGLPSPDGRLKVGEHGSGREVDPDRRRGDLEPGAWQRLLDTVAHWVPGVRLGTARGETCLYASTPTDDFVLDRVGPIVVAAGLGGHGFKFGPAIGRVVADLVEHPERASAVFGLAASASGATGQPGRSGSR